MKCTLVGTKVVDYVSKKTGRPVKGHNLFITREDANVTGLLAEDLYLPDSVDISGFHIGDDLEVYFNRFGGVEQISLV